MQTDCRLFAAYDLNIVMVECVCVFLCVSMTIPFEQWFSKFEMNVVPCLDCDHPHCRPGKDSFTMFLKRFIAELHTNHWQWLNTQWTWANIEGRVRRKYMSDSPSKIHIEPYQCAHCLCACVCINVLGLSCQLYVSCVLIESILEVAYASAFDW